MEGRKTINHIGNVLMIAAFCCVLLALLILNIGKFRSAFAEEKPQSGMTQEKLLNVEQKFRENIYRRTSFINIYGIVLNVLQEKIVGNFDFVKDNHGIIQRFSRKQDYTPFLTSVLKLEDYSEAAGVALVYVTMPDKAKYLQMTDEYIFDGQQSRMAGELLQSEGRVDCIEVDKLMAEDPTAPSFEEFFFKTDVHCSTYGEFWVTKELVRHLEEQYQLVFSNREEVFDLNNYMINSYAFLGNTARSAGKYFVGLDEFEIYKPNFKTSFTLNNPSASETKTGDFENVMLNGFESRPDISEYTYWVTDFGRFTSPRYEYTNHNAPDDAPSVLVISDSVFMRGVSYLALACQKVTVLDPRYFGKTEYLAAELDREHYDAIIVIGTSVTFFGTEF